MFQRALNRNPILAQRQNQLGDNPPLPQNPFLLKARKNLDLPTPCLYLLNSEKYRKFSPKTIKMLLSKHAKKKPFGKMSLGQKKNHAFSKIIAGNVKRFSYYADIGHPKPEIQLFRLLASSYKHLEHLDVSKLDIQNKPSFYSIAKLNHLQSLSLRVYLGKFLPGPRLFQQLKHLQHITLSIAEPSRSFTETPENTQNYLVVLTGFLYGLTLLPSLESYSVEILTTYTYSQQIEDTIGAVLYYLNLLKAKRFSLKTHCPENLNLKLDTFSSLTKSVDTFEYKYFKYGPNPSARNQLQAPISKRIIFDLLAQPNRQSFQNLLNACHSLESLSIEQNADSISPSVLKLPQTLKTLAIRFSDLHLHKNLPDLFKTWEALLSSLENLEKLTLILSYPDEETQRWTSQLPQRVSLKNLKQYHFRLEGDSSLSPNAKIESDDFLTKWSKNLQGLSENLECLTFETTFILLKSLDFFTLPIASLSKLKTIKLNLLLHPSQPREMLELAIPFQNLPSLEHVWLDLSRYVSKDSATKLLFGIENCQNLQSFVVSGLAFNEGIFIPIFKRLPHLKDLEVETDKMQILTINASKEIIKHKARFFIRRSAS